MGSTGSVTMGLFGMANSFFNPQQGYEDADEQLKKSWNEAKGYQQPFQQAGANEIGRLTDATGKLLDPKN